MNKLFDFTFNNIIQILFSAIIIYAFLIIYLRFLGKRSNSKFNSFDWIVTVSVGSLLASTVILKDVSIIEGGFSVLILLLLQFVVTKTMLYSKSFRKLIKATPKLLYYNGEFIEDNLNKERVLKSEILATVRLKGLKSIQDAYAIVLETDAQISIIPNDNPEEIGYSLYDVEGLPEELRAKIEN